MVKNKDRTGAKGVLKCTKSAASASIAALTEFIAQGKEFCKMCDAACVTPEELLIAERCCERLAQFFETVDQRMVAAADVTAIYMETADALHKGANTKRLASRN